MGDTLFGVEVGFRWRGLVARWRHAARNHPAWNTRPTNTRPGGRHRAGTRKGQVVYPFRQL